MTMTELKYYTNKMRYYYIEYVKLTPVPIELIVIYI